MRKYLIDVNIISYLADRESPFHEAVRGQFRSLRQEDIAALSILGLYELYYSLSKAGDALDQDILRMKEKVCAHLPIIPLTENGAKSLLRSSQDIRRRIVSRKRRWRGIRLI